jgi:hypothetical protein
MRAIHHNLINKIGNLGVKNLIIYEGDSLIIQRFKKRTFFGIVNLRYKNEGLYVGK